MATSEDVENYEFIERKLKELKKKNELLEAKKADILEGSENKEG